MAQDDVTGDPVSEQDTAIEPQAATEAETTAAGEAAHEHEHEGEEEKLQETLKKVIQVGVADVGLLRKALTITVPRDALQAELDKDYKEIMTEAVVPGFRRGRAPRRLVEKRFGEEVGEQVQTRLLSSAYLAAIDKQGLKVLGDPLFRVAVKDKKAKEGEASEQLVDLAKALEHMKLPDEGEFTFRCEVEVQPEFELPKLDGVPVEKPKVEITDEDVDAYIDRYRAMRGNWAPVPEGVVQEDDLLVCEVKMHVDGKEIKTIDNQPVAARGQVIEGATIADLGEKLAGAKYGDTRQAEGKLPDDYDLADLRGKQATFQFKVLDIKRLALPPLDKDLLTAMGYDDEAECRTEVRRQLDGRVGQESSRAMRLQVRKYLLENTKLDLPEGISSRQTARVATRRIIELQREGVPMSEIEKHADDLRTKAREQAVAEIKLYFILERIAETLEIKVSEEEVNEAIASIARSYNRRFDRIRDDLIKSNGIESLAIDLRDEKCIDAILAKAEVKEAKVERKKKARAPQPAAEKPAGQAAEKPAEQVAERPAKKSAEQLAEPAAESESKPARPRRRPPPKKTEG
jgi:trigger factor